VLAAFYLPHGLSSVMATHGYGGFRRWMLGSVADTVLHTTMTPLLLVPAYSSLHKD
jgi:hypothetical protein